MDGSPAAVDLFSGAGGFSHGFRSAGFTIRLANDIDPNAAATYRLNHPEVPFVEADVADVTARQLLALSGLQRGTLDVLLGGPPCQDFSINNHRRSGDARRARLVAEYLRIVDVFRPRFVVMENVTGILSSDGGRWVAAVYEDLEILGYHVEHRVLKAEEFGVPQQRRRVFFIGSRDGDVPWPQGKGPRVTVRDALGDLPALTPGGGMEEAAYDAPAETSYQRQMRRRSRLVLNHHAPSVGKANVARFPLIPPGGSWRDLPLSLLPPGMLRAKRADHTKRYGRLEWSGLASTVLTKCDPHWGAFIHPGQDRTLSVREAARLQSFPDRFRFVGSRIAQARQVGNAVPPLLAEAIAQAILAR